MVIGNFIGLQRHKGYEDEDEGLIRFVCCKLFFALLLKIEKVVNL